MLGPSMQLPAQCIGRCLRLQLQPASVCQAKASCRRTQIITRSSDPTASNDTAADLLAETDALLRDLSQGAPPPPPDGYLSDDEGRLSDYRFEVKCDVNGCIITPVAQDRAANPGPPGLASPVQPSAAPKGPANFSYHEGDGWKIGLDEAAESEDTYSAVIGSDTWSIALTRKELVDFIQLLKNLRRSVTTLDICGQWGEKGDEATLEMETKRVWMQGRAPQKRLSTLQDFWRHGEESTASMSGEDLSTAFSLRFIIKTAERREVEGQWYPQAVMDVFEFLDNQQTGFLAGIQANPGLQTAVQEPTV